MRGVMHGPQWVTVNEMSVHGVIRGMHEVMHGPQWVTVNEKALQIEAVKECVILEAMEGKVVAEKRMPDVEVENGGLSKNGHQQNNRSQ
jgi:hypothetical protein